MKVQVAVPNSFAATGPAIAAVAGPCPEHHPAEHPASLEKGMPIET